MSKNINVESIEAQIKELVNKKNSDGMTPLHHAAKDGKLEEVKYLISKGAIVNSKDIYGVTPLHEASFYGHSEVVKSLISNGANINLKSNDGNTPLHYASLKHHLEVVKYLISNGANVSVNIKNNNGFTPSYLASREGRLVEVVEYLKEFESKKNVVDANDKVKIIDDILSNLNKLKTLL